MKFFADTACQEDIDYCFAQGVNDGITTNPKIMESTGDLSIGFEEACKAILQRYPNVPVSLETDLRGIDVIKLRRTSPTQVRNVLLEQASMLSDWAENVVVKIPVCDGGLLAANYLAKKGIKTNITACMTPYQALLAADYGIGYVSLFANRMLDSHLLELSGHPLSEISENPNWKDIVKAAKPEFFEQAWTRTLAQISYVAKNLDTSRSQLIVGSIRDPQDITRLVKAEPQVITIPTKIVKGLENIPGLKDTKRSFESNGVDQGHSLYHPMTEYTLIEFEKAADSYRN